MKVLPLRPNLLKASNCGFFKKQTTSFVAWPILAIQGWSISLLETLEHLLYLNPEEIFLLIGLIIRSGKSYGYHLESMAEDLMVCLVERFLAE